MLSSHLWHSLLAYSNTWQTAFGPYRSSMSIEASRPENSFTLSKDFEILGPFQIGTRGMPITPPPEASNEILTIR